MMRRRGRREGKRGRKTLIIFNKVISRKKRRKR